MTRCSRCGVICVDGESHTCATQEVPRPVSAAMILLGVVGLLIGSCGVAITATFGLGRGVDFLVTGGCLIFGFGLAAWAFFNWRR